MTTLDRPIVVTGGAGFLGSHIVDELRAAGYTSVYAPRSCEWDLRDPAAVSRLFREYQPDVLIHAAAVVGGIGANRARPADFFYDNALMGVHAIDAAHRFRTRKVVVLGTVCAYPKLANTPFSECDLWSGYPEETNAPYGIAKKALLVQCQAYREQYGLNAIYLLPVNLYGPRDHFDLENSHVIPALIRKCVEAADRQEQQIAVWGNGRATREFLFVRDAARGIVAAMQRYDGAAPVNLGSGHEIPIAKLARLIAEETGFGGRLIWDASRPNGQPRRCLDITRAYQEFGFRATTSLREGLRETIRWYLASRQAMRAGS
ncbi:MAG TPA: GDP-L-fucose synthase [Verrucomicrobiae bacterium]|nr:GDP-L-fucose synthase [Verrucomicrobiae bacterium]